jgi:hypothetical protein
MGRRLKSGRRPDLSEILYPPNLLEGVFPETQVVGSTHLPV